MTLQTVKVSFATGTYKNVDGIVLNDDSESLINGILDEKGGVSSRPGLRVIATITSSNYPVHGLYWWSRNGYALAVCNGSIYKITKSGSAFTSTLLGSGLGVTNQVSFATDGSNVYMANGGRIYYTNGTTVTLMADADAPTAVTQLAYVDGYLLANNGSNTWHYSDVNNATSWTSTNIATTAGNSDLVTVIRVLNREIYFLGSESTEIWENNGTTPFERLLGGYLDNGCIAPFSVITTESGLYWLDETRMVVRFNGRTIERVSTPFDSDIHGLSTITDCLGHRIEISGKELLVFNFPSAQRTLVYNLTANNWSEWSFWRSSAMQDEAWLANCHEFCPGWGIHLCGDRFSGLVYQLDPAADYDGTTDQYEIRTGKRTGHLDYGTSKQKQSQEFRLRLKRGVEGIGDAVISIRWRDDNGTWTSWRTIELGPQGDTQLFARLFRTGIFRSRQYEIVSSDFSKFVMADAEEDIEVLR